MIYFEGVYRESDVWLNGKLLWRHQSGYTSFAYDLTRALKPGRNVLAVRCDAALKEGWWFEACGINAANETAGQILFNNSVGPLMPFVSVHVVGFESPKGIYA